ncbi:hypothetical protein SLEP1_g35950 [Rubroshorea leprosula]|uniref:Uncharacterized protein n=1 Tax=Rubroshorea leprosula TaxID=152421 RepID=A0AAV5KQG5_9ROSI|nr:hypothetical protein SLEP1_g35950 [Rubroshorea leprosula]
MASFISAVAKRLEGKVALITGGASGQTVCESIDPSNSIFLHCDVTNESQIQHAVDKAVAIYGKLDIMINNAGILGEMKPHIIDKEKSDFERVLSVNVTGIFLGIKHAARIMVPARSGCIISTAGLSSGNLGLELTAYLPMGFNLEELKKMLDSIANLKGVTLKAEDIAYAALFIGVSTPKIHLGALQVNSECKYRLKKDFWFGAVTPLFGG